MQNLEMLSHLKSLYIWWPPPRPTPLIYSKFHMICLFYLSLPGVIADVNYQKVTLFTQSNKSFGHCKNISLNITVQ